ncbi:MAG: dTDP-4-amino-4,6-dideoxygalactose transaminase [Eubacterium sp.]|nr:dTDP-4-amino-4,6-dideoxygalactose transaminase [Eubacterium sp.]
MGIDFNIPPYTGRELQYVKDAIESHKICGDGAYTARCSRWLEEHLDSNRISLTTSGTAALDMAALLCDLQEGDEVILPSYTFSSTATAAALRGAKLVFVDIRPDTMNLDENLIEQAVTDKTKAIIVMHYAGVSCEMDTIMEIAGRHHLLVIEDAAQGVLSTYKGNMLGTIGNLGCYSFHETKNYSMGEGGALSVNDTSLIERAEILREKGTNRTRFFRGEVDKYTWVDLGDSFLPSELNAAYLWGQLEVADEIMQNRMDTWNAYHEAFQILQSEGKAEIPVIPPECTHNAHMYWLKLADLEERSRFIHEMKEKGVHCVFHYIPLHSSPAGVKFGIFAGEDRYTTKESERLVRLPLYYGMQDETRRKVIDTVMSFFC